MTLQLLSAPEQKWAMV